MFVGRGENHFPPPGGSNYCPGFGTASDAKSSCPANSLAGAPADEEPPVEASQAPDFDFGQVQQQWRDVYQRTRQLDQQAAAVLNSGRLVDLEGNMVILQMQSDIMCEKLEGDQCRVYIEQALRDILQYPLRIRGRVSSHGGGAAGAGDDLLGEDSLTAFAVNELGGKISKMQDDEGEE